MPLPACKIRSNYEPFQTTLLFFFLIAQILFAWVYKLVNAKLQIGMQQLVLSIIHYTQSQTINRTLVNLPIRQLILIRA